MSTNQQHRRNRPLQVESLESVMLLSGLSAMMHAAEISAAVVRNPDLTGPTRGTFFTTQSNPDTGKDYHVTTHGTTTSGTKIDVTGDLFTPGFIAKGRTTGTLTVATANGTLTLDVKGPLQKGFSPLPSKLGYTITGGTGVFAHHHHGSGTITVSYKVTSTIADSLTPIPAPFTQSGTISLVFKAGSSTV